MSDNIPLVFFCGISEARFCLHPPMSLQIILHENYTVVLDKNDKEPKTAFIAGWGTLYKVTIPFEYLKKYKSLHHKNTECATTDEGPEKFESCRPRFLHSGSLIEVDKKNGCSNEDPPVDMK